MKTYKEIIEHYADEVNCYIDQLYRKDFVGNKTFVKFSFDEKNEDEKLNTKNAIRYYTKNKQGISISIHNYNPMKKDAPTCFWIEYKES